MRTLLHKLMVDITRHPREIVDFVPSNSIVCTIFRAYEHMFGRRAGIRFEGMVTPDGLTIHGTWEHFLAHQEARLRAFKNPFAFKLVPLPVLITPDGQRFQTSIFNFAIAFDNANAHGTNYGVVSSATLSYTVTGSNPLIMGWGGGSTGGSSLVTGMTYNSVSLTAVKNVFVPSDRWWDCYLLAGPATGANNLVASQSGATDFFLGAISYSGCKQSSQPDASNNSTTNNSSPMTGTVTVVASNCWIAYMSSTRGSQSTANSPGVARYNPAGADMQMFDSNGTVSTGSNTCSVTANFTGSSGGMVMVSIAPVAAASVNSGMLLVF